jgi:hypothetical protein
MCKTVSEDMVYTMDGRKSYQGFKKEKLVRESASGGFCSDKATLKHVKDLFKMECPKCHVAFPKKSDLANHVKKHEVHFCQVCLKDRPVFISDQITFTKTELHHHMQKVSAIEDQRKNNLGVSFVG